MLNRRQFLIEVPALARVALGQAERIRQIDIIHHTHTDVGYTSAPSVVRDQQKRYIDAAIDLCTREKGFCWTIESILNLHDWWQAASQPQQSRLLTLIDAGRVDVMGLPLNQAPMMNALQWRQMMSWIPDDLWRRVKPRAAMQNDVNGFPRAGAIALLNRGIRHLLMGINADSGGPPFRRPSAFWWKMRDGRRLFVWLGDHYGRAMAYLGATRQAGLPSDERSVRAAHANCLQRVRKLESEGYEYDRLILTFTHPGSYDNGAPFPPLAPFVEAWNGLGLQPALRLVIATDAVMEMEKKVGSRAPVLEGEWTDWWVNGCASGPREVAASRYAKRYVSAALSPAWGPMPAEAAPSMEAILKDLCLFDEHTWGASTSIKAPDDLRTLGQYVEKSELAYRPMGRAEWLLARRSRTKIDPLPEGIYAVNAAPAEFSGWASIHANSLFGEFQSLVDASTGAKTELLKADGALRFWLEKVPAHSMRTYRAESSAAAAVSSESRVTVKLDATGWPLSASWPGMRKPLFEGSLGEFLCVGLIPPADRRTITRLHANPDAGQRAEVRRKSLLQSGARYDPAERKETPHTWIYEQKMRHDRLGNARRRVELWKREPRARISVRLDRLSSVAPEMFYLAFALPEGRPLPVVSSGGVPFTPYTDQLPGSCRDYFGIDGWAHYATGDGDWIWVTRDAPVVSVGGPHALERHESEPADRHRILAMVFDNCWHTNFVADSHGAMEFQFELAWMERIAKPADLAEALVAEPVVMVNRAAHEDPALMKNLFRP